MQSIDAGDPLLHHVFFVQVQQYVHVASVTASLCDNLHTLPLEVQYIWLSPATIATVLYYITRYGLYVEYIAKAYNQFVPSSLRVCSCTIWVAGYIFNISIWAGEALLGLRVLSLYGKDRRLTYSISIIFVALFTTALVTLGTYFNSVKYRLSPVPQITSCVVIQAGKDILKTIVCAVVWNILMLILLLRSACYAYKSGDSSEFVVMLYRDGIIYYIYTLALQVGNLVAFFVGPSGISSILTSPTRLLHAAFICRVVLYTRRQQERTNIEMTASMSEEARCTSHSLGA